MDYDAKQIEKRRIEQEKRLRKFRKSLGLQEWAAQSAINKEVLSFAKKCQGWHEICLDEAQMNDKEFMLKLFRANDCLVNQYYIPKNFRTDSEFVIEYLKLSVAKRIKENKKYRSDPKLDNYDYRRELSNFKELRENPEFLAKFADAFPECNLIDVIYDSIVLEEFANRNKDEKFRGMIEKLPHKTTTSQASRFGRKSVRLIPKTNPNFMEAVIAGIGCDGFESLSCLPFEMIYENRALIAVAANSYSSKVDAMQGLKNHFGKTLSPDRCDNDWYYTNVDYYPLLKALVEDDILFDNIKLPDEFKNALRKSVSKEVNEFYDRVRPYDQRQKQSADDKKKTPTVVDRIAENVQNSKKGGK